MIAYRIEVIAPTASFRHPTLVSSYQPTLPVPPVSTILGIFSSVTGKWVEPKDYVFGYVFHRRQFYVDLETIYKTEGILSRNNTMKVEPDIVRREIFFEPILFIYVKDNSLVRAFKTPHYPLLLGRSSDLATVKSISQVTLSLSDESCLYGTAIPFERGSKMVPGRLQALPTYFENTLPRKPKEVKPYLLIYEPQKTDGKHLCDPELSMRLGFKNQQIGVYFYE